MKKGLFGFAVILVLAFSACGDSTTEIVTATSQEDDYTEKSDSVSHDTVYVKGGVSCYTRELLGGRGVKIVCDGDSVGVLLNGSQGEKGDPGEEGTPGAGCSLVRVSDTEVRLFCGGDSTTIYLGTPADTAAKDTMVVHDTVVREIVFVGDTGNVDETKSCVMKRLDSNSVRLVCDGDSIILYEKILPGMVPEDIDSAKIPMQFDSLKGVPMGPFVSETVVSLHGLSDGRTLRQTGIKIAGEVSPGNGRYRFRGFELPSQYALIEVSGRCHNISLRSICNKNITLYALVNLLEIQDLEINVNVLTHMEYNRVYHLVAQEGMPFGEAKRKAQKEILSLFHFDLEDYVNSEDMAFFGNREADAALLAISFLMETVMSYFYPDMGLGYDYPTYLENVTRSLATDYEIKPLTKVYMAEVALEKDDESEFATTGSIIGEYYWGQVSDFKKYVRIFLGEELGLGVCGSDSVPKGTVRHVTNSNSTYYAESYTDTSSAGKGIRFICTDGAKWRIATEMEKDTVGLNFENTNDGTLTTGVLTGKKIVWDANTLRYADSTEVYWNKGCISENKGESLIMPGQLSYYKCTDDGWVFDIEKNTGSMEDTRDNQVYRTMTIGNQIWTAENMNFAIISGSQCYDNDSQKCKKYGRLYNYDAAMIACPSGWHLPDSTEWVELFDVVGDSAIAGLMLKSSEGWEDLEDGSSGNGLDAYGFTALPGGNIYGTYSASDHEGFGNYLWSATEVNSSKSYGYVFGYDWNRVSKYEYLKSMGLSVRCVKN